MPRLILALLLSFCASAWSQVERSVRPSPDHPWLGPAHAEGAILWAHGSYDYTASPPPPVAPFVARLPGWDVWRFDRRSSGFGSDPLDTGGSIMAEAASDLRAMGYRRVVLAGHSRGAFHALAALRHGPSLDALILISPAAHGTNPARRPQALTEFATYLQAAPPGAVRGMALVLFADDPFEPDLGARADLFRREGARIGATVTVIIDASGGHDGGFSPVFEARRGLCLATVATGRPCP